MFPTWACHYHIPTIGDRVHIPHMLKIGPSSAKGADFGVQVQPRSIAGKLSVHACSMETLLKFAQQDTWRFLTDHLRSLSESVDIERMRVDLKKLLESYRSLLEYTAHHIANACSPRPRSDAVKFPVAKRADDEARFSRKLDMWFPKLKPQVKEHILSLQHFRGENWLLCLADLTNANKHRSLSVYETRTFTSVIICYGPAGIRIGELGFESVILYPPRGVLRFEPSDGDYVDLAAQDKEVILDSTLHLLPAGNERLHVYPERRVMFTLPGLNESVLSYAWRMSKNVLRTVNKICQLLS